MVAFPTDDELLAVPCDRRLKFGIFQDWANFFYVYYVVSI